MDAVVIRLDKAHLHIHTVQHRTSGGNEHQTVGPSLLEKFVDATDTEKTKSPGLVKKDGKLSITTAQFLKATTAKL